MTIHPQQPGARTALTVAAQTPLAYERASADLALPARLRDDEAMSLRVPTEPLVYLPHTITEISGPALSARRPVSPGDADLTRQHRSAPIGERIVISGHVYDTEGRPLPDTLVEVWQANAGGRYRHRADDWAAPLDPNFSGAGRCVCDPEGRYRFRTIKPGSYPWGSADIGQWRPAHVHFSLIGRAFCQRLITQMYFPGDPFFVTDPFYNSVVDPAARARLVATFSPDDTIAEGIPAYRWDIHLRGPAATRFQAAL